MELIDGGTHVEGCSGNNPWRKKAGLSTSELSGANVEVVVCSICLPLDLSCESYVGSGSLPRSKNLHVMPLSRPLPRM